jgi:hypothetical protein
MLRIRYRGGVAIGPHGFPDWIPYARAVVQLPAARSDLGVDEARVLDLLTANEAVARGGDPLWVDVDTGGTPAGWTWAHVAMTRQIALVPVELHGAFRHLGGVSTGGFGRGARGLRVGDRRPPGIRFTERLSEEATNKIEEHLGYVLPAAYRSFLAGTNGGRPARPAVHPGFGFLVDQPFFGVSRRDWLQDLVYANEWFGDRLSADWLAVGYVQGGLIAVRVRGGDEGSVWYWDDDDHRDTDEHSAEDVCERLLHRCADDFGSFWRALCDVPEALRDGAIRAAADALVVAPERLGTSLPAARRPPWATASGQP